MASRKRPTDCPECGYRKPEHRAGCRFGDALAEGYPGRTGSLWAYASAVYRWVAGATGTSPQDVSLRLVKLTEECGEAAQAYIGMTGQNPRKGVTHTVADVASELCDVAVTALVALHDFTPDPRAFLDAYLVERIQRLAAVDVPAPPETGWKDAPAGTPCPGCGALRSGERSGLFTLHREGCPGVDA